MLQLATAGYQGTGIRGAVKPLPRHRGCAGRRRRGRRIAQAIDRDSPGSAGPGQSLVSDMTAAAKRAGRNKATIRKVDVAAETIIPKKNPSTLFDARVISE